MGPVIRTEEHWVSDRFHVITLLHTDGITIKLVRLTDWYNAQFKDTVQEMIHTLNWADVSAPKEKT